MVGIGGFSMSSLFWWAVCWSDLCYLYSNPSESEHKGVEVLLSPQSPMRYLIEMYRSLLERRIDDAWIWKMAVHPKMRLFIWKVAWDRISTCSLLGGRGMEIFTSCLIYGLEDETTEHTILSCPRVRLIWRSIGGHPWKLSHSPWHESFLEIICQSSVEERASTWRATLAYIAY